ncbi:biotin synthase BioB [Melghirimyces algeriensis]|uniref:Biotin synthase n=1 Tax=Melghirimyces algeriensis TaxID=910412 RepID=A0A521E184_9BACL|nr:biotin synthase BioB [Melghirimyces algeriensis]SMO77729.1 biotin synthase [Melghirimyces algeriensis]
MSDLLVNNPWEKWAEKALEGGWIDKDEALRVLESKDDELLLLLHAAYRVRQHYFGKKVKLNMIFNAKSGLCPEDCGYCSQSIVSNAPVEKYSFLKKEVLVEGAREAIKRKAGTYCIVASGRGPGKRELDSVCEAVQEIKAETDLKICACLGLLTDEQAKRLKEAGVDRYNHNLNTSREHHEAITTTHTYDDRVQTVTKVKQSGISPCSGCIVGMGETNEQIVELAYELRSLDVDSIPVNFLHAIPGTPLENMDELDPGRCLKILCLFRFLCPDKEIRISGGREVQLRTVQPLALYPANAIFVGDYLTTEGQLVKEDHQMIRDMGFEIEGEEC